MDYRLGGRIVQILLLRWKPEAELRMQRIRNPLKLLFVHEHLGAFGGAETNILLTASELKARGHAVSLLYANGTGRDENSWREVFEESYSLARTNPQSALACSGADLVYLHNLGNLQVLEDLSASRRPVVRMVHDHSMYCLRNYKYNYFTRQICTKPASFGCVFPCLAPISRNHGGAFPVRWASIQDKMHEIELNRRFARFIVYSDYSRQELVRNGFPAEHIHLHVPIRCSGDQTPWSTFDPENVLLFAGQIIRGKGVDVLLRALRKVRTPFKAVILGDGSHRQKCQKLAAKLGLLDRVTFEGYVPPDQMSKYYGAASVFLMSSLWPEPFGMVGPEAMRYGLPVVAFDAGGISEWLLNGENGYLVPWADTDEYASRIDELLSNKELARDLGRNGRARVNKVYNSKNQVNVLEGVFNSLMPDYQQLKRITEDPVIARI